MQELQKELELQVGLKQEMEVAMKLLEKDIHEKQDTLAALRQQLDQVKSLNLQMFNKAQVIKLLCVFVFILKLQLLKKSFCPKLIKQTKQHETKLRIKIDLESILAQNAYY